MGYLSQAYHHNPLLSIILKERTIRNSLPFQTVKNDSDAVSTCRVSAICEGTTIMLQQNMTTGQHDLVLSFKQRVLYH